MFQFASFRDCIRAVLAAATLTSSCGMVAAAPDSAAAGGQDAIMNMLSERGLFKPLAASATMAQSLRDSVRDRASDLVMTAMNFLGVPYRWGGANADAGFDCSGFTRHIFENSIGLVLPRRSDDQAVAPGLLTVGRSELKPGDLVFFNTMKTAFSHVGIYVGDDKFIHAPRTGSAVRIDDMRNAYWTQRYAGARRADLNAGAQPAVTTR